MKSIVIFAAVQSTGPVIIHGRSQNVPPMVLRALFVLWSFLIAFSPLLSLAGTPKDTIEVSEVKMTRKIKKFSLVYVDAKNRLTIDQVDKLPLSDTKVIKKVLISMVHHTLYLTCLLSNQADTACTVYFTPGFYFTQIQAFEKKGGSITPLPVTSGDSIGFKKIKMEPHSVRQFYFKLRMNKSDLNVFDPSIVRDFYYVSYLINNQNAKKSANMGTFIISGIMLMMIFYSLAVFFLNGNISFLYYACYALCLGTMFFLIAFTYRTPSRFSYFYEAYLSFILHCVGTSFYIFFLQRFIEANKQYPKINRLLNVELVTNAISILLYSYIYYFQNNFPVQFGIENITKVIWLISAVIFVLLALRTKNHLLSYLAIGHSFLLVFSIISLFILVAKPSFPDNTPEIFTTSILYFEFGICLELVFFLAALAAKNRSDIVEKTKEGERLKIKAERQDFEKQLAVFSAKQEERNRISADMHDELGSGVTAIRLMSEIVKSKMKEATLPEIERISNSANDLINKMNTLIWTMKSENDTLESLIAYLRTYALEFFENTSITCNVKMPSAIRTIELTGEKRRNIFLTVKETLNNVLKHSKADVVTMTVEIHQFILIKITDNGVGIHFDKLREFGSGLKNMKKRIEGIGGEYTIKNNDGPGATTAIELPV